MGGYEVNTFCLYLIQVSCISDIGFLLNLEDRVIDCFIAKVESIPEKEDSYKSEKISNTKVVKEFYKLLRLILYFH